MARADLIELCYQALASPLGLVVWTPDRENLRRQIYQAKGDISELAHLQLRFSPYDDQHLLIVNAPEKKGKANG